MDVFEKYQTAQEAYQKEVNALSQSSNQLSFIRFIIVIAIVAVFFIGIKFSFSLLITSFLIALVTTFIILVNFHFKINDKKEIKETLLEINKNELNFLKQNKTPFENGSAFLEQKHIYAFDLDIFGEKSLYQHLNRTATYLGGKKLASFLTEKKKVKEIIQNQKAVEELKSKFEWRQNILASAKLSKDDKQKFEYLTAWLNSAQLEYSKLFVTVLYGLPSLLFCVIVAFFFTKEPVFFNLTYQIFLINLFIGFIHLKNIKKELNFTTKTQEITKAYAIILSQIENESFKSNALKSLQKKLLQGPKKSSALIQQLSNSITKLESLLNPFSSIIMNGFVFYHLHVYNALQKWKKENSTLVNDWIHVIAYFESLNSLANFSYNNPEYAFPELNENKIISFKNLGHPLLKKNVCVNNDIDFTDNRFVILTGSNMSGKSTFLRSLGVNIVLACCGSVVCAKSANIHPMQLLVSMRLMDSLEENESYFFAEVKKLKLIMDLLEEETSFVLLDEILRGTNSDDKRQGTIEVIKQMITKKAIGVIATHDLEVCKTTLDYPETLANKCFEVEIVDNDLKFDFKIREGICKNKSASFLMKKMEVI